VGKELLLKFSVVELQHVCCPELKKAERMQSLVLFIIEKKLNLGWSLLRRVKIFPALKTLELNVAICLSCPTDAFKLRLVFMLNIRAVPGSYSCVRRTGGVCNEDRNMWARLLIFHVLSVLHGVAPF